MRLGLFVALRHLTSPRRNRSVSLTGLVSVVSIFIGVSALTVILSVMNGIEEQEALFIHDREAQILLKSRTGIGSVAPLLESLEGVAGVKAAAPRLSSEVLISHYALDGRTHHQVAMLTGVDPMREARVTAIMSWLPDGALSEAGEAGIVLGRDLANSLRAAPGDQVVLVVPGRSEGKVAGLQAERTVVGLIDGRMAEFNATAAYENLSNTIGLLGLNGEAGAIAVSCDDPSLAEETAASILALPAMAGLRAETWMDRNRLLFEAVAKEKALMYLFLVLTMGVASLGIVSTLTVMVSKKRAEIGILRTLGLSGGGIMRVMVLEGFLVGLAGVLPGLAAGWGVGRYLLAHPPPIPWDLFILEKVPICLNPVDFILVGAITLLVTLLATLYPGWEASRTDPISAIRRR